MDKNIYRRSGSGTCILCGDCNLRNNQWSRNCLIKWYDNELFYGWSVRILPIWSAWKSVEVIYVMDLRNKMLLRFHHLVMKAVCSDHRLTRAVLHNPCAGRINGNEERGSTATEARFLGARSAPNQSFHVKGSCFPRHARPPMISWPCLAHYGKGTTLERREAPQRRCAELWWLKGCFSSNACIDCNQYLSYM